MHFPLLNLDGQRKRLDEGRRNNHAMLPYSSDGEN